MLSHLNSGFHQLRRVCQAVRTLRAPGSPSPTRQPRRGCGPGSAGLWAEQRPCCVLSDRTRCGEMNTVSLS